MTGTFSPSKRSMEQVYVSLPVAALDFAGTTERGETILVNRLNPVIARWESLEAVLQLVFGSPH